MPVVDATGKAIASATLSHDDGQLFVLLNSTTKGRLSARADLDTSNARSETRLFRRPGHQLDNHRLTCFTSGVKLDASSSQRRKMFCLNCARPGCGRILLLAATGLFEIVQ